MAAPDNATSKPSIAGNTWQAILKHNDVLLGLGMLLIIVMMLIPLPSEVLDILLTLNLAFSVTILMVTLYTQEALEYSTFPTVLLVSTLARLGLNVSSSRLILLNGDAGQVIDAFGHFVIGGNYVIGLLIFIILLIINFIVITNGAGRVSEVAARFTLDAMPGKQLSIDADLNAGIIDEKQAKERRKKIEGEADFYGTMDGASKFVKGDAIAAIIITVVNIVGGLIIGVVQKQMDLATAAQTFTILSVGDGLVSQLPALIISSATGILVTRVSSAERSLGEEIGAQMFNSPKILGIVGGLVLLLGLTPGMPTIPFLLVGGVAAGCAFLLNNNQKKSAAAAVVADARAQVKATKKSKGDDVLSLLNVETLELEIGYRLVPLIEPEAGGDLLDRISQIRRQMATELGFILPSIRVRDNLQLAPNAYNIKLRGVTIEAGDVQSDLWLAMSTDPDVTEPLNGMAAKEPAFGLPAVWIHTDQKEDAEINGYTVVSPSAVVATHLTEVIKRNASEILSRADVNALLNNTKKTHEALVTDLIPEQLSESQLHLILQMLLSERVCVRDMVSILEALSYHSRVNKEPDYLHEQTRMALSRAICKQHADDDSGELPALTISPELEDQMAQALTEDGKNLALGPVLTQRLFQSLNQEVERVITQTGAQPAVLCNSRLRLPVRRLTERLLPQIAILSYNEIGPTAKVRTVGSITVDNSQVAA